MKYEVETLPARAGTDLRLHLDFVLYGSAP